MDVGLNPGSALLHQKKIFLLFFPWLNASHFGSLLQLDFNFPNKVKSSPMHNYTLICVDVCLVPDFLMDCKLHVGREHVLF